MSEFTIPVAKTDPVTEPTTLRKPNSLKKLALAVTAAALVLTACGESTVSGQAAPNASATTSAEPTPSISYAPTTTETTPTTTTSETTESSSATTEIDVHAKLCDKAAVLGITERLGAASCTVVTTDENFTDVLDGARWQSGTGDITVKVIKDTNGIQFGVPSKWHGLNVQSNEYDQYGLQGYNPICNEDACYTFQKDNNVYGNDIVYEAAAGSRAQNLALLGRMVNGDN